MVLFFLRREDLTELLVSVNGLKRGCFFPYRAADTELGKKTRWIQVDGSRFCG